jgi:hypothetical protein
MNNQLAHICVILVVGVGIIGIYLLQVEMDQIAPLLGPPPEVLYFSSGMMLKQLSLGHEGLLANLYWMRAVQYFGDKKIRKQTQFPLLGALINIAATLDPDLAEIYQFGSIFLSEPAPVGAASPQEAVKLLQKGIVQRPKDWRLYRDLGFVYYWYLEDYPSAAHSFLIGSKCQQAPPWMKTMAAELSAQGGNLKTARFLWQQVYETTTNESIRVNARENLMGLVAKEDLEYLQSLANQWKEKTGKSLPSFRELVMARLLKDVPRDPKGFPYQLDPLAGAVKLHPNSTIRRLNR